MNRSARKLKRKENCQTMAEGVGREMEWRSQRSHEDKDRLID
jgi:hypothetical protein